MRKFISGALTAYVSFILIFATGVASEYESSVITDSCVLTQPWCDDANDYDKYRYYNIKDFFSKNAGSYARKLEARQLFALEHGANGPFDWQDYNYNKKYQDIVDIISEETGNKDVRNDFDNGVGLSNYPNYLSAKSSILHFNPDGTGKIKTGHTLMGIGQMLGAISGGIIGFVGSGGNPLFAACAIWATFAAGTGAFGSDGIPDYSWLQTMFNGFSKDLSKIQTALTEFESAQSISAYTEAFQKIMQQYNDATHYLDGNGDDDEQQNIMSQLTPLRNKVQEFIKNGDSIKDFVQHVYDELESGQYTEYSRLCPFLKGIESPEALKALCDGYYGGGGDSYWTILSNMSNIKTLSGKSPTFLEQYAFLLFIYNFGTGIKNNYLKFTRDEYVNALPQMFKMLTNRCTAVLSTYIEYYNILIFKDYLINLKTASNNPKRDIAFFDTPILQKKTNNTKMTPMFYLTTQLNRACDNVKFKPNFYKAVKELVDSYLKGVETLLSIDPTKAAVNTLKLQSLPTDKTVQFSGNYYRQIANRLRLYAAQLPSRNSLCIMTPFAVKYRNEPLGTAFSGISAKEPPFIFDNTTGIKYRLAGNEASKRDMSYFWQLSKMQFRFYDTPALYQGVIENEKAKYSNFLSIPYPYGNRTGAAVFPWGCSNSPVVSKDENEWGNDSQYHLGTIFENPIKSNSIDADYYTLRTEYYDQGLGADGSTIKQGDILYYISLSADKTSIGASMQNNTVYPYVIVDMPCYVNPRQVRQHAPSDFKGNPESIWGLRFNEHQPFKFNVAINADGFANFTDLCNTSFKYSTTAGEYIQKPDDATVGELLSAKWITNLSPKINDQGDRSKYITYEFSQEFSPIPIFQDGVSENTFHLGLLDNVAGNITGNVFSVNKDLAGTIYGYCTTSNASPVKSYNSANPMGIQLSGYPTQAKGGGTYKSSYAGVNLEPGTVSDTDLTCTTSNSWTQFCPGLIGGDKYIAAGVKNNDSSYTPMNYDLTKMKGRQTSDSESSLNFTLFPMWENTPHD